MTTVVDMCQIPVRAVIPPELFIAALDMKLQLQEHLKLAPVFFCFLSRVYVDNKNIQKMALPLILPSTAHMWVFKIIV